MLLVCSKLDYRTREPRYYRDRRHLYLAWAFNLYVRFMCAFAQGDWSHAKDCNHLSLSVPRTSQCSRANVDSLNRNFVLKLKKFLTRRFERQRAFKNNHLVFESSNDCCTNNQRCALRTPHDIRCRLLQCLKFV
jgi:hypothetical protein